MGCRVDNVSCFRSTDSQHHTQSPLQTHQWLPTHNLHHSGHWLWRQSFAFHHKWSLEGSCGECWHIDVFTPSQLVLRYSSIIVYFLPFQHFQVLCHSLYLYPSFPSLVALFLSMYSLVLQLVTLQAPRFPVPSTHSSTPLVSFRLSKPLQPSPSHFPQSLSNHIS